RVLDLGSGGGIDVLLSARRVGPTGKVYGLDMTEEMLALALDNAAQAGVSHVEFLKGSIEAVPLPANTIDVVISNCVINLSVDKPTVFTEIARVLTPGGRIGISDIVAADELTAAQRAERGSYVGCIAGGLSFTEYRDGLRAAGLTDIDITATHTVADQMYSAIVRGHTAHRRWGPVDPAAAGRGQIHPERGHHDGTRDRRSMASQPWRIRMSSDTETFAPFDAADYLDTAEDVAAYLEAFLEESSDDPTVIARALGTIARSRNV